MFRFNLAIVCLLGALTNQAAQAARPEWCGYVRHTPEAVFTQLRQELLSTSIAVVPPHSLPGELRKADWALMRNGMVAGWAEVQSSVGFSELIIFNVDHEPLFALTEEIKPCETLCGCTTMGRCGFTGCGSCGVGGLCSHITLTPLFEKEKNGRAPFELVRSRGGYFFLRYGCEINPVLWRGEFATALDHVQDYLATTKLVTAPAEKSTEIARFVTALASSPVLAPYLPYLQINRVGRYWQVSGRLPQLAYDALVDQALRSGYTHLDPRIVIDSGAAVLPLESARALACFR
jgi:hypothetical protein